MEEFEGLVFKPKIKVCGESFGRVWGFEGLLSPQAGALGEGGDLGAVDNEGVAVTAVPGKDKFMDTALGCG